MTSETPELQSPEKKSPENKSPENKSPDSRSQEFPSTAPKADASASGETTPPANDAAGARTRRPAGESHGETIGGQAQDRLKAALPFAFAAVLGGLIVLGGEQALGPAFFGGQDNNALRTGIAATGASLKALENRLDTQRPTDLSPLSRQIATLDQRIAAQEKMISAAPAVDPHQLADLADRLATLQAGLAAQTGKVEELSARLAKAEDELARAPEQRHIAAISLLAASLGRAALAGGSYRLELDALKATAPELPQLASLGRYADQGVPVLADIARTLPDKAIGATFTAAPNASFAERLLASAKSWVNWRSTADGEGTGSAQLEKLSQALAAGRGSEALDLWQTLPAPARAASQSWGDQLEGRVIVENAVADLGESIVRALETKAR